jgi:hypothetical protein
VPPPPLKCGHRNEEPVHCRLAFDPVINEYGTRLDEYGARIGCEIYALKATAAAEGMAEQIAGGADTPISRELQRMRSMASRARESVNPLRKARQQIRKRIHRTSQDSNVWKRVVRINVEEGNLVIVGKYREPSEHPWCIRDGEGPAYLVMNAIKTILPKFKRGDPLVLETQEAVEVFTVRLSAELTSCVNRETLSLENLSLAMEYIRSHLLPNRRFWFRNIKRFFERKSFN